MLAVVLGAVIGLVIGGLGGGGGVLTVPALVHVLGMTAQDATTSSVVIVGVTAAAGVLARVRGGHVRWRTGLAFGAVGVPAAAAGSLLNQRVAEPVLLVSFAALTLLAAAALLVDSSRTPEPDDEARGPAGGVAVAARPVATTRVRLVATVVLCGSAIGFLTGFLGVGGGFLVVPALVLALRLPVCDAIGTSLLIITINGAAAFAVRAGGAALDWGVIVPFTAAAVAGGLLGTRLTDRLPGAVLSRAFAVLLVVVGAFVGVESLLPG